MTAPPEHLADRLAAPADGSLPPAHPPGSGDTALDLDRQGRSHDLLSDVLRSVRVGGERIVAYAPSQTFSLGFADVGTLHIIEEGTVEVRLDNAPHGEDVTGGDVVLLPRGDAHRLHWAGVPAEASSGQASSSGQELPARWLTGTFAIGDPQASPLLAALPAMIILRGGTGPALEGLEVAHRMLLVEIQTPSQGSAVMVARILDLIFIQILRTWAAGADAEPNWLAGALDPLIGPALSAIHRDPGQGWTVEQLARLCSLSRSAFAARFAARTGQPPATYLAHVRLDAATDLLRHTSLPVAQIAEKVSYTSEAAFSRAFKNRYGTPPARWRQLARPSGQEPAVTSRRP
jgi:AraC-like DNA-binding protein